MEKDSKNSFMALARLRNHQYQVISYNDKAKVLQPGFWSSSADSAALRMTQLELKKLVPLGPTNFEKALRVAAKQKPADVNVLQMDYLRKVK